MNPNVNAMPFLYTKTMPDLKSHAMAFKGMAFYIQAWSVHKERASLISPCTLLSPPQLCSLFSLFGFPPRLLVVRHCLYFYSDILLFLGDCYFS